VYPPLGCGSILRIFPSEVSVFWPLLHDVVGSPTGPIHGPAATQAFYDHLINDVLTEVTTPTKVLYGEDFCVVEHECAGVVRGEFLGMPGNGKRVTFRMLHVWEFKGDAMSRENVWLDGGSIAAQLTAVP
jgi:hypothetical protein